MVAPTNNSTDIQGVTSNRLPTGTYTSPDGQTHAIVDSYDGKTYDGATNSTQAVTLNGVYQAGATLTVTDTVFDPATGAQTVAATALAVTANANGTFTATTIGADVPNGQLVQGDHHFVATTRDANGNVVSTDTFEELVRRSSGGSQVPNQPALVTIADGHDTSGTASPTVIANHGLVFSGTSDPYALITVYVGTSANGGGQAVADQVQADSTGHWSVAQDPARGTLPETNPGQLTFVQVTATDLAGNSASNATQSYQVDTTNPTLAFTQVNYTDSSGGQHDTNVRPVSFSGTVSDDHTVDSVVVNTFTNGNLTGHITATVAADGTWSASGNLSTEGTHTYSVTATDEAGNQTTTGNGTAFVYDATAPSITNDQLLYTSDDLAQHSTPVDQTAVGGVTIQDTVTDALSPIRSVQVFDSVNGAAAVLIGTETTTDANTPGTTQHYQLTTTLQQGSHSIYEVVTDAAGNVTSEVNRPFTTLVVDTTAPTIASTTETYSAPVGSHATGDAVAGLTNDASIRVTVNVTDTGGAVTNDGTGIYQVAILDGTTFLGNATHVAGTNNWTYDTSGLSQGDHTLHAQVYDAVGNRAIGANLATFTLDTVAPAQPTVALTTDSGSSATDLYTNNDVVVAHAEVGSTVKATFDGTATQTAVADANGTATFDPAFTHDGQHTAVVTATDPAGNVSTASSTLTFQLDTNDPVVTIANNNPNAQLNVANNTATLTVTFDEAPKNADGSAHTVALSDFTATGGTLSNLTQVDATHYTVQLTDTSTSNSINDTVSYNANEVYDQAGNANLASNTVTVHGDTIAPNAPVITDVDSAGYNGGDPYYTETVVSGHAEAGASVTIYDTEQYDYAGYPVNGLSYGEGAGGQMVVGTTVADANGRFSIDVGGLASDETHVFTATATDAANNVSDDAATVAAAILSPADTYSAAAALSKSVGYHNPDITNAISNGSAYFVVGSGDGSSDLVNAGRSGFQVINDEYSTNATITVGASQFSVVHGGTGATITAGSGQNVFVVDALYGFASTSPSNDPQSIHGFKTGDSIDVSQLMTGASTIEVDQTATGSVLIVHNSGLGGIGGLPTLDLKGAIEFGQDTVINITGAHLTTGQIITAVDDPDYYNVGSVATADTAALVTSVALDGTRTELASGNIRDYGIALDGGAGYITHDGSVATVTGLAQVSFADATLSFDVNGPAATVYREHLAAFGTAASADDLASGTAFLTSGHSASQLAASYLAVAAPGGDASLSNQQFVDQTYQNAFGRAADAGGEAYWTGQLNAGESRADLVSGFANSGEAHFHTDTVVGHGLLVESNTTLAHELIFGTPGSSNGASGISEHDALVQVTSTEEFTNAVTQAYGDASNQHIVDYLYQNIFHRTADGGGEAYWTGQLDNHQLSVGDLAYNFATGDEGRQNDSYQVALGHGATDITAPIAAGELVQAIFGDGPGDPHFTQTLADIRGGAGVTDEAGKLIAGDATLSGDSTSDFVNAIYNTAFDRDADAGGKAFWTDQIDNHGLSKAAFVTDIISSTEFQGHFDPHAAILAANAPIIP